MNSIRVMCLLHLTFRQIYSKPILKILDRLAEILGQSGVNSSLEAVVISGGLLTKDAALAFLLMENLGQKKVSVFMDLLDKWTKPGFTLTKDSTAMGTKKIPDPLAIPLMTYQGNIRRNVTITNLQEHHWIIPQGYDRVRQGDTVRVSRRQSNSSPVHRSPEC